METLTVMIPNFNKALYIEQCFDSIIAQTCDRWHVVCVDDGSTDGSRGLLGRYGKDPRFTVRFKAHEGIAATMREIIGLAATDIVFGLGSDDMLVPEAVEAILGFYEAHPGAGFVYSNYWALNYNTMRLGYGKPIPEGKTNLETDFVSPLRTFRRKYYYMTEGYDVTLPAAIDKDIIYKLEEVTKPMFLNKPLAVHRILKDSVSHSGGRLIAQRAQRQAMANAKARRLRGERA
jgi:glycosyltransferase involved in cell wall biosynthesis